MIGAPPSAPPSAPARSLLSEEVRPSPEATVERPRRASSLWAALGAVAALTGASAAALALVRNQGVHINGDEPSYLVEAESIARYFTLNSNPGYNYIITHHIIYPFTQKPGPNVAAQMTWEAILEAPSVPADPFGRPLGAVGRSHPGRPHRGHRGLPGHGGRPGRRRGPSGGPARRDRSPWRFALAGVFLAPSYPGGQHPGLSGPDDRNDHRHRRAPGGPVRGQTRAHHRPGGQRGIRCSPSCPGWPRRTSRWPVCCWSCWWRPAAARSWPAPNWPGWPSRAWSAWPAWSCSTSGPTAIHSAPRTRSPPRASRPGRDRRRWCSTGGAGSSSRCPYSSSGLPPCGSGAVGFPWPSSPRWCWPPPSSTGTALSRGARPGAASTGVMSGPWSRWHWHSAPST